jgi:hypothetical protein
MSLNVTDLQQMSNLQLSVLLAKYHEKFPNPHYWSDNSRNGFISKLHNLSTLQKIEKSLMQESIVVEPQVQQIVTVDQVFAHLKKVSPYYPLLSKNVSLWTREDVELAKNSCLQSK